MVFRTSYFNAQFVFRVNGAFNTQTTQPQNPPTQCPTIYQQSIERIHTIKLCPQNINVMYAHRLML